MVSREIWRTLLLIVQCLGSLAIWLDVSSNLATVLHFLAKMEDWPSQIGPVNRLLLLVAGCWVVFIFATHLVMN